MKKYNLINNNESYPIHTIYTDEAIEGGVVQIEKLHETIEIPVFAVGERGRGRKFSYVSLSSGNKGDGILNAKIYTTKSGRIKLVPQNSSTSNSHCIVIMMSKAGFRGSNSHTGGRASWYCQSCDGEGNTKETHNKLIGGFLKPEVCPTCQGQTFYNYHELPLEILAEGNGADGDAGRMGNWTQYIGILPKGEWLRLAMSGRLYGRPATYYYKFTGEKIIVMNANQFEAFSDLENSID